MEDGIVNLRQALLEQSPSLALQRAAADEIARLDARLLEAVLTPGAVYLTRNMGLAEYQRVDVFQGEHTLEFRSVTYGSTFRIKPQDLAHQIGAPHA